MVRKSPGEPILNGRTIPDADLRLFKISASKFPDGGTISSGRVNRSTNIIAQTNNIACSAEFSIAF